MCIQRVGPCPFDPIPKPVLAIKVLPPPYRTPSRWVWVGPEMLPKASGAYFEFRFGRGETSRSTSSLAEFLRSFRRVYPGVPMIAGAHPSPTTRDPPPSPPDFPSLPFIRAIFTEGFDQTAYRTAVARVSCAELAMWLNTILRPSKVSHVGAITCVVQLFSSPLAEIATDPVSDTRSLLRELRSLGLPGCKRWRMLARALPGVLAMQRDSLTVAEAGRLAASPEEAAFRRHCRVLFGLQPSTLRGYAGWEWLLARFIEVSGPSGQKRTGLDDFALSVGK